MSKKNWFYLAFFAALVVGFYFALSALIPGFNERKPPPISFIRPFTFTDQDGKPFTEKQVEGKVFVAEYFFTTCKTICPVMNTNMLKVHEAFRNEKDFLILSHSSTPEIDSPSVLKHYSDSLGVSGSNWVFLTGRKDSLYTMARVSYVIDDPNNIVKDINDDFIHTQHWALVDRNGDVRKIYDGLKQSEVDMLIRDARSLLKEKK